MSIHVIVHEQDRSPQKHSAFDGFLIGREPTADCVLKDQYACRWAVRIVNDQGLWYVVNLGVTNPARIGERALKVDQRERVVDGLVVQLGKGCRVTFLDTSATLVLPPVSVQTLRDLRLEREAEMPAPPRAPNVQPLPPGLDLRKTGKLSHRDNEQAVFAAMSTHRPRLVIVNDADRRGVPLPALRNTIGANPKAQCRIDHVSVSDEQASIEFDPNTNRFAIAHCGRTNPTYVDDAALTAGAPHPLRPETVVRFGAIEAVFVVDLDWDNAAVPPGQYARAGDRLVARGEVTDEQLAAARERAKREHLTLGEALLLSTGLTARAWKRAFDSAVLEPPEERKPDHRWRWWCAGAAAAALGLAWYYFQGRATGE